jgi:hypothetical protein
MTALKRQAMYRTYNVTPRSIRTTIVSVEKQQVLHILLHILSVCLYPYHLRTQCACAILSFVACPALQNFPTLSHKWHDFFKTLLVIKYAFSSTTFV